MKQEVYTDLEPIKEFAAFSNEIDVDALTNWLFHKGIDGKWAAIPREKITEYWNDYNCEGIIRSSQLETVIELAEKVSNDNTFLDGL